PVVIRQTVARGRVVTGPGGQPRRPSTPGRLRATAYDVATPIITGTAHRGSVRPPSSERPDADSSHDVQDRAIAASANTTSRLNRNASASCPRSRWWVARVSPQPGHHQPVSVRNGQG